MTRNLSHTAAPNNAEMEIWVRYLYGIVYLLICTVSVVANGMLIFTLTRERGRNAFYILLLGLCSGDFVMSAVGTFYSCLAHFLGAWVLYSPICQIIGAIMTFLGLSQILLLSCISFTRFSIITDPHFKLRSSHARRIVCCSYGFCLIVALCPILGWSYYTQDAAGMSCEPVWGSSAGINVSYNIFLLVGCFIIPLLLITFSYIMIFIKVKYQSLKRSTKRIGVTTTILIMIVFFLLSWAPYTVYSVFQMSGSKWTLNPNLVCIPGMFAKSSALWNPIIYFLRNSEFRKQCMKHFKCLRRFSPEQRTPATHYVLKRKETEIKLMELIPGKESTL